MPQSQGIWFCPPKSRYEWLRLRGFRDSSEALLLEVGQERARAWEKHPCTPEKG